MSRGTGLKPIRQCGECSTLFLQPATQTVASKIYELCPNPHCNGPISKSEEIGEPAVAWAYQHIIAMSNIDWRVRKLLRSIAENSMGEWQDSYRYL